MEDHQHGRQNEGTSPLSRRLSCPQCESGYLFLQHCKAVCENCGYVESCEDNFVPNQDNPVQEPIAGV